MGIPCGGGMPCIGGGGIGIPCGTIVCCGVNPAGGGGGGASAGACAGGGAAFAGGSGGGGPSGGGMGRLIASSGSTESESSFEDSSDWSFTNGLSLGATG